MWLLRWAWSVGSGDSQPPTQTSSAGLIPNSSPAVGEIRTEEIAKQSSDAAGTETVPNSPPIASIGANPETALFLPAPAGRPSSGLACQSISAPAQPGSDWPEVTGETVLVALAGSMLITWVAAVVASPFLEDPRTQAARTEAVANAIGDGLMAALGPIFSKWLTPRNPEAPRVGDHTEPGEEEDAFYDAVDEWAHDSADGDASLTALNQNVSIDEGRSARVRRADDAVKAPSQRRRVGSENSGHQVTSPKRARSIVEARPAMVQRQPLVQRPALAVVHSPAAANRPTMVEAAAVASLRPAVSEITPAVQQRSLDELLDEALDSFNDPAPPPPPPPPPAVLPPRYLPVTLSRRHQARQVLLECREETSREPYAYSVQELRRITDEAVRKGRVGRQAPRPSVPRGGASRQNIAREPPRVSFLDLFLPGLL